VVRVNDAEHMAERLRILAEAAHEFSAATQDLEALLSAVARRLADVVKDLCVVRILSEDGRTLVPVAVHARDEHGERFARAALTEPVSLDQHHLGRQVLESGEPFFAPKLDLEELRARVPEALVQYCKDVGAHSAHGSDFLGEYTTRVMTFAGRRARMTVIRDVTEQRAAEQTRALLAAIVESAQDAIISKRLDGTITSWNAAAEHLFGYARREVIGKPITILVPSDRFDEERALIERITAGGRVDPYETVRLRKDGTEVVVSISLAPIRDPTGKVVGASKTAHDLTARRKAAAALQRAEEQLRQSQKMEAVGRLAGGVAHDFNNMLSVILSYGDLMLGEMKPGEPMRDDLEEIRKAGRRAADLTRQLLMFSRQQMLEPRVVDLNEVLANMDKMLQRILGADVDLVSLPSKPLGRVRIDPSSVEQVIMNLVVNARDAMPTGGQLTMETADVELDEAYAQEHFGVTPGPHVMLAITDSGTGMDRATLARIFEPFFTTKGSGKGTGLGLSTVFGIVQQGGGSVWVYSEPGKGTTFKVYLPRVDAAIERLRPTVPPTTVRGSEMILLVEDDDQVRAVARGILVKHGYHVIEARNGGEALLISEKHAGTIHLLLSDVVMPQMSGPELARRLASTRPGMRVLCMSGYTDDSIVRHGVLEARLAYLQKPITPEALATRVREVLDGKTGHR
jgi:PAS domain S-box-containing protein